MEYLILERRERERERGGGEGGAREFACVLHTRPRFIGRTISTRDSRLIRSKDGGWDS